MITKAYVSKLAAEAGFSAACFCLPEIADEAPENVKGFVLLLKSYVPQDGAVDAFYVAKNESYKAAQLLIKRLEGEGVSAILLSNLKLKPIATHSATLVRGKNTLNYHAVFGSKFCMELLGLEVVPEGDVPPEKPAELSCDTCGRCMKVCPGGAITKDGFIKENCIRFYMMSGKPMPEHLRVYVGTQGGSYAAIGCDICQRVCPGNRRMEAMRGTDEAGFSIMELLECSKETLERFGTMYGRNYAIRNRIIAQALLAAGNSGDSQYLPLIRQLKASPSPIVSEHAAWAEEKMTKLPKIY